MTKSGVFITSISENIATLLEKTNNLSKEIDRLSNRVSALEKKVLWLCVLVALLFAAEFFGVSLQKLAAYISSLGL